MKKTNNRIFLKRIAAILLDFAFLSVISLCIFLAVYYAELEMVIFYASASLLAVIYPIFFELLPVAATPGMMLMGIHLSFDDSKKSSGGHIARTLLRAILRIIFCLPLGVGFFSAFADGRKRTLYDNLSSIFLTENARHFHGKDPCLISHGKNGKNTVYPIGIDRVVIGRNPAICNIVYPANEIGVSRTHCSIHFNRQVNLFLLEDLGSSCGTYLETGRKVSAGKVVALDKGASFYVASKNNLFTVDFAENVK